MYNLYFMMFTLEILYTLIIHTTQIYILLNIEIDI